MRSNLPLHTHSHAGSGSLPLSHSYGRWSSTFTSNPSTVALWQVPMPRFKSGIGPTGKNGKKKMPDAASSASVDEEKPRCHKKKPRPRVELDLERDERIAL